MALKNFIKENFVLVVGLTLPVLLVIMFFVASVLPRSLAVPPQYEMLFWGVSYGGPKPAPPYDVDFFVQDNLVKARVVKNNLQPGYASYNWKKLMAYDGKTQSVREIPYNISEIGEVPDGTEVVFTAFRGMKVDGNSKSPDGYEFDTGSAYGSGGLMLGMFGGGYRNSARVVKGAAAFKLPEGVNNNYYGYDVHFVGWILEK